MTPSHRHHRLAAIVMLAGTLAVPALAQDTAPIIDLTPRQYNAISVVNGGANADEADAIKRMARQYPLRIVISGRGGSYYVAQSMKVFNGGRLVAEIPDAGPWVLMDLAPGRYTLEGQFEGLTQRRDVTVTGSGTTLSWVLPSFVN